MAGQHTVASFELDDRAFQASLKHALEGLIVTSTAELLRLGIKIQNTAREYCPVSPGGGRLRSSITFEQGEDAQGPYVDVGTNVEYAPYVEYGHRQEPGRYVAAIEKRLVASYVPPQPFMRPALLEEATNWNPSGIHP